jgi:hypothetical protein
MFNPAKRIRRTATTVMAGHFDIRPPRDVLTSLLNGVAPYKSVEKDDHNESTRRNNNNSRAKEKRERERERRRLAAAAAKARHQLLDVKPEMSSTPQLLASSSSSSTPHQKAVASTSAAASSFWRARPAIHIATMQRSVSVTPPPLSSPPSLASTSTSTPAPTHSVSTSRTSSKRPLTPDEEEEDEDEDEEKYDPSPSSSSAPKPPRKKRVAVRKGWKGWVEGSPPPSEKLINLDSVPIIQERRTRSGKVFDAAAAGKDNWVCV